MLVSVIQFVTEIVIIIRRYYYIKHLFQLVHISTILICKVKINVKKKTVSNKTFVFIFLRWREYILFENVFIFILISISLCE